MTPLQVKKVQETPKTKSTERHVSEKKIRGKDKLTESKKEVKSKEVKPKDKKFKELRSSRTKDNKGSTEKDTGKVSGKQRELRHLIESSVGVRFQSGKGNDTSIYEELTTRRRSIKPTT